MPAFGWVLIIVGGLILPIISLTYLLLVLPGRRTQLVNLFSIEKILYRYLAMRGRLPKRGKDEPPETYSERLKGEFDQVFSQELGQEYSTGRYVVPMLMAWGITSLAIVFLVAEGFGASLRPNTPLPVVYSVLGAIFWSIWSALRRYTGRDLMPGMFYWVVFRYVLAVAYGLLATEIFTATFAHLGAFVAATLPFGESIRLLGSRLGSQVKWWSPVEGHPKLSELQGMNQATIEKLEEHGVHTTQELAFSDPLDILLRSNFPPKVLIDWMDQAFLYNYVGEKVTQLRSRGIRGAIELASLRDEKDSEILVHSIAEVLGIGDDGIRNLIRSLYLDNHLRLIWELWGVFEEDAADGMTPEEVSPEAPNGGGESG